MKGTQERLVEAVAAVAAAVIMAVCFVVCFLAMAVFVALMIALKLALEFALAALATLCFILTANAVGGVQYVAPTEQNIAVLALCLMLLRRFLRFKF